LIEEWRTGVFFSSQVTLADFIFIPVATFQSDARMISVDHRTHANRKKWAWTSDG
jgi:hypothetical protein